MRTYVEMVVFKPRQRIDLMDDLTCYPPDIVVYCSRGHRGCVENDDPIRHPQVLRA